jgi:hypothetical protein
VSTGLPCNAPTARASLPPSSPPQIRSWATVGDPISPQGMTRAAASSRSGATISTGPAASSASRAIASPIEVSPPPPAPSTAQPNAKASMVVAVSCTTGT